jgi:hypothetical protein
MNCDKSHDVLKQRERSCFMRAANSDAELDSRIYALGEFVKIGNIAKRLSIQRVSSIASHLTSHRCQENWPAVFWGILGLHARSTMDVGYRRHNCWRKCLLGWVWAYGKKSCDPSGEKEKHQV